ncbi:MAG: radical SAM protein [Elusimicrobiota bacterium]
MERLDLKLGFTCNNRCRFCVQGDKRARFGARTSADIDAFLRRGRARGASALVLTGGEPTVHPTLPGTVRLAAALGFTTIQIQTNGRRFFYADYCRELLAAGVTEFSPALHGSSPEIHDGLTRAPGSFQQTLQGIRNLKELGAFVLTNTVVTTRNYRDLPELARLFTQLGVDQFQFAFMHIVGEAGANKDELTVRKTTAMPFIQRALDIGRAAGTRCYTEAVPYCLMRGYEDCVAEKIIPRTMVFDAETIIDDYTQYRHTEGKAKGPRCAQCRHDAECEGPWKEYAQMFGWEEFKPAAQKKKKSKKKTAKKHAER